MVLLSFTNHLLSCCLFTEFEWLQMKMLEQQYHDELKKELQGAAYTPMGSNVDEQTSAGEIKNGEESTSNIKQNVEDSANMPLVMMSRRKRKLLEAVQVKLFWAYLGWSLN